MAWQVLFFGGNGHSTARLGPARAALEALRSAGVIRPFALVEVPYPGFEDRPRAPDLATFLDALGRFVNSAVGPAPTDTLLHATGIGGLLALCLRSRGIALDSPLLLQAPVLWGLERRLMPRLMRRGLARAALEGLFRRSWFQRWFGRRYFERSPAPALRAGFFDGYAHCAAAADLFAWLTPALLRELESRFAEHPAGLERVTVWWGDRDRVVTLRELEWTEQALGVRWARRTFPAWGHYPMIDCPEEWVRELSHALATPGAFSGSVRPEAG
jgi:hypothetical protein